MERLFFLFLLMVVCVLNSCATTSRSVVLGVSAGAATGAATGAVMRGDGKGATFGGLALGVVGGLSGYFFHKSLERRDENVKRETIFNLENYQGHGEKRRKNRRKECFKQ